MVIAAAIISVFLSGVLALGILGWVVNKTRKMPDQIIFDSDEALEFCAQALPDAITAEVSYLELQTALRLHLEWIQAFHWTPESDKTQPVLYKELDPTDYMVERAELVGLELSREQLQEIMVSHNQYLTAIGALYVGDPETARLDLSTQPEINSEN